MTPVLPPSPADLDTEHRTPPARRRFRMRLPWVRPEGTPKPPKRAPLEFLRRFAKALVDEGTYDVRANPSLWVGFLMALPIPLVTFLSSSPPLVRLLALPAPIFWSVLLGAAGRVGILADQASQALAREVATARSQAAAVLESYEEALDEEVTRRQAAEQREESVVSELKLAEAVHRTLVPDNIHRSDVEVAVRQIATQFVGGDYLHATVVADRYLYVIAGDVSGHGVAAALVVARLHGIIRRMTLERRARPETLLEELNRAALDIFRHTYFFMTIAVMRLDLRNGRLRYATAGHPPQILLRNDGSIELLRTRNRLLGIDADIFDAERPAGQIWLQPGDSVVLFTDGLFEILGGEDGEMLGETGLQDRIRSLQGLTPSLMVGEILQELADFQGRSSFEDDVSLMVARWSGPKPDGTEAEATPTVSP